MSFHRRSRRRPWFRHTGMHVAPRGGEVFTTGPVSPDRLTGSAELAKPTRHGPMPARPVKAPRSHPKPLSRHELGETSADLLAPLARPYVPLRERASVQELDS